MTEDKIQALVDRGLLRPKAEVEWKAAAGELFPTEDVKEQVVFTSFFKCGFNLPMGDFFRGLLYYYKLELVHLVPNSITVVSTFIHFCEAYLGISPHFVVEVLVLCEEHLKMVGANGSYDVLLEVGAQDRVDRYRSPRQYCWVEVGVVLYCRSTSWASTSYWPQASEDKRVGFRVASHDLEDLEGVLELVSDMKKQGVTGAAVASSFSRWMIQSIKDRVHPAYEYWGQSDPTREVNRKVSKEDMAARISQMYSGKVKIKKCPKVHSLKSSADLVRP
jgi:hypothetical protein